MGQNAKEVKIICQWRIFSTAQAENWFNIHLPDLLSSSNCYDLLRKTRWPNGVVVCVRCGSKNVVKNGCDVAHPEKQEYRCKDCHFHFDDLTGTVFAGHHQPLEVWMSCVYLMAINVSNRQIANELDLSVSDVHDMTTLLRQTVANNYEPQKLSGTVECDEAYIVAGHKGNPEAIEDNGRQARRRRLKGSPGRGTLAKDKPPIIGMAQRNGDIVIHMVSDVKKETIEPIIRSCVLPGSTIYTDEYVIYNELEEWGYVHKTVNHGLREYARDEDGDGFFEIHVNTAEGFWSLLRSWLRPHRGISQKRLPIYLRFFEFVHNTRRRGKSLLSSLMSVLLG